MDDALFFVLGRFDPAQLGEFVDWVESRIIGPCETIYKHHLGLVENLARLFGRNEFVTGRDLDVAFRSSRMDRIGELWRWKMVRGYLLQLYFLFIYVFSALGSRFTWFIRYPATIYLVAKIPSLLAFLKRSAKWGKSKRIEWAYSTTEQLLIGVRATSFCGYMSGHLDASLALLLNVFILTALLMNPFCKRRWTFLKWVAIFAFHMVLLLHYRDIIARDDVYFWIVATLPFESANFQIRYQLAVRDNSSLFLKNIAYFVLLTIYVTVVCFCRRFVLFIVPKPWLLSPFMVLFAVSMYYLYCLLLSYEPPAH